MLNRYLRIGLCSLLLLLAFPANAEESVVDPATMCGEVKLEEGQICLRWFHPGGGTSTLTPGAVVNVVFDTKNLESVCEKDLKCFVEKEGGKELSDCNGGIDPANVYFFKDAYRVIDQSEFLVSCKDKAGFEVRIDSAPDKRSEWSCHLVNRGAIWKNWEDGPLLPNQTLPLKKGEKQTKANPWNGTKAYCPDPFPIGAINAYQLSNVNEAIAAPEIVQRYLIQNCSRVIKYYQQACAEAASKKLDIKQEQKEVVNEAISTRKQEMIVKIVTGESGDCGNVCESAWAEIKDLTLDNFPLKGKQSGVLRVPQYEDSKEIIKAHFMSGIYAISDGWLYDPMDKTLAESLATWFIANKDEWISSEKTTLDLFIESKVYAEWLSQEKGSYEADLSAGQLEYAKIQEIVSYLNKRYLNLQMHFALSKTQTYDVSSILRRSEDSTEVDLSLFDNNKEGEVNIIDKIIRLIGQVLGSLGVLLLIISGVVMIVSQGEETMLQKAKQTFMYTLIGLIVAFMAYTIVRFIIELLLTR